MKLAGFFLFAILAFAQEASQSTSGKALFEKKCGVCHESETSERRIGPSLKGVKDGKLPDSLGKAATHENILKQINNGGNGMPVFRDLLTDDQKESLVTYVMTL